MREKTAPFVRCSVNTTVRKKLRPSNNSGRLWRFEPYKETHLTILVNQFGSSLDGFLLEKSSLIELFTQLFLHKNWNRRSLNEAKLLFTKDYFLAKGVRTQNHENFQKCKTHALIYTFIVFQEG